VVGEVSGDRAVRELEGRAILMGAGNWAQRLHDTPRVPMV
jgi:hypothetical protein